MTLSIQVFWGLVAATLLVFGVGIGVPYYYIMGRFDQIEKRVDDLWSYLIRGAQSEAVAKGLGNLNSPFVLNETTRTYFKDYLNEFKIFYQKNGIGLSDSDLFIALDKQFGERLVKDVEIPNGFSHGSVITAAVEIAKEPTLESDTDVIAS